MKGFFTKEETQSKSRPDGKIVSCVSCGLYNLVLSPYMKPSGRFDKGILNIGESPGEMEDKKGKPWQGKVGRLLKRTLRKYDIELFGDCLNMNAVDCRPPENREPKDHEITCCRQRKFKEIDKNRPNIIILLGNAAIKSYIGSKWKKNLGGVTRWRGWTIPDRESQAWVCPIYHPSYVERQEHEPVVQTIWEQDIERISNLINKPTSTWEDERSQITILERQDDIDTVLEKITLGWEGDYVAFDYETTGVKPHARGHRIVCVSLTTAENTYAFMFPTKRRNRMTFERFLVNKDIGKIAHNMKFEDAWSRIRAQTPVYNWIWDSMQAAHLLDNRSKVTGLKFQAYVHFGLTDYDSHIEPYLRTGNDGNGFNHIWKFIEEYGENELLTYCGTDSLLEYRLTMKQMRELGFNPNSDNSIIL